ncbi:MAG: hypothetical protein PHY23_00140 [Oscillospiraceae bacterium]|nr:hypothetical protein [Oscillospiraceae bacterium]
MEANTLSVHPQILELYAVLEQNGLHRQKEEVQSLVKYIEGADDKLSLMMAEIQEMRGEISKLHDKGVRAKCSQLIGKVESKIQQAKAMVSTTKNNLIASAGNAVKTFREKGRAAFVQAVGAMRIPAALSHMKNGLSHAAQSMNESAGRLDAIRGELHEMGGHMGNAGRALLGKPAKQSEKLESDKGVLAKLRSFLEGNGKVFSSMARGADNLLGKLQSERPSEDKKQSVKSELAQLKTELSQKPKAPAVKEQAR